MLGYFNPSLHEPDDAWNYHGQVISTIKSWEGIIWRSEVTSKDSISEINWRIRQNRSKARKPRKLEEFQKIKANFEIKIGSVLFKRGNWKTDHRIELIKGCKFRKSLNSRKAHSLITCHGEKWKIIILADEIFLYWRWVLQHFECPRISRTTNLCPDQEIFALNHPTAKLLELSLRNPSKT